MTFIQESNRSDIDEVVMDRLKVLKVIKNNRETHQDRFNRAIEGYKTAAIEVLEKHIKQIQANSPERVFLDIPLPEDHMDDYDEIIKMLESNQVEIIVLTQHQYRTYILDNWGWKQAWSATTAMYVGGGR